MQKALFISLPSSKAMRAFKCIADSLFILNPLCFHHISSNYASAANDVKVQLNIFFAASAKSKQLFFFKRCR